MAVRIDEYEYVSSSNVDAIGYDASTQTLEVIFKDGSVYRYSGVSAATWEDFRTAPSKGKFVWQRLRDKYAYVKL